MFSLHSDNNDSADTHSDVSLGYEYHPSTPLPTATKCRRRQESTRYLPPIICSSFSSTPEMQLVPGIGWSGLQISCFFLDFWSIFAKIKSRDTLLCMSNQFCWCLWQSLLRKIYDSVYIKWKLMKIRIVYHR